jgi:hypothetical protein
MTSLSKQINLDIYHLQDKRSKETTNHHHQKWSKRMFELSQLLGPLKKAIGILPRENLKRNIHTGRRYRKKIIKIG